MLREDYAKWLARGREHQRAGRPIDAMVCYRRALNSNKYAVQARYRLGEVLRALGRHEEARAAWLAGLAVNPEHERLLLRVAAEARNAGAQAEAIDAYRRILEGKPEHIEARIGLALSWIAQGDETGYAELGAVFGNGVEYRGWDELARALAAAVPSAARRAFLLELAASRVSEFPPLLLAVTAEEMFASGAWGPAREVLARAETLAPAIYEAEILRRLALAEAASGVTILTPAPFDAIRTGSVPQAGDARRSWAERYAQRCEEEVAAAPPVAWPRRTAGEPLRIAYLIAPGVPLVIGGVSVDPRAYLRAVVAAPPRSTPSVMPGRTPWRICREPMFGSRNCPPARTPQQRAKSRSRIPTYWSIS
jgi:tetratricopeptide (TPR) repeat protein